MKRTDVSEKIKGCILGGAVGDALGFPVEFYDDDLIFQRYGEFGITEYSLCGDTASISDDTQMSMFTADGMISAERKYESPTIGQYVECVYESYLSWLSTQDSDYPVPHGMRESELLKLQELHSRRAPGNTCISALQSGICGTLERKINWSKGCGGVMRVAPVVLLLSQKGASRARIGETAARVAAITHSHPLGYIPAAFLALLIDEFLKSGYQEDCVSRALADTQLLFEESEELNYFCSLIVKAEMLANDRSISDDLDAIRELGAGWVAEETVAIAVYCTLRYKDNFEQAIIASVNHSGDSDSTGAVTGNLIGALLGFDQIPQKYLTNLELKDALLNLAEQLSPRPVIVEYRESFAEDVKDLLVELQEHISMLDRNGILVLKENFRDGYFSYVWEDIQDYDGKIFLAMQHGIVIGVIICQIFQGLGEAEYTTRCPKIGFISDLVVTASERGRGVGKALLKRAEEYFSARGCEYTHLEAFAPNTKALEFYKKRGYEVGCMYLIKKINTKT